jgi:hypothetical protein
MPAAAQAFCSWLSSGCGAQAAAARSANAVAGAARRTMAEAEVRGSALVFPATGLSQQNRGMGP